MNMSQLKKFAVFILFCVLIQCSSQADYGTVTVVYDGDTLQVRLASEKEEKIRLIGVDAPETGAEDEETRLKALLSKRFAFKFLFQKSVKIEYDWEKRDQYGRLLAYIWTKDGTFFNEWIIQKGFASPYTWFKYKTDYKKRFVEAEETAKIKGNGFWKELPYPLISRHYISDYMGQLVSYEFVCERIEDKGNLLVFRSRGDEFSVPLYKKYLNFFPEIQSWVGQKFIISGLLEEYNNQPQIMLFLPSQLKKQ